MKMKFTLLKGILSIVTFTSIALVKAESDCKTLQDIYGDEIDKCVENDEGNVVKIEASSGFDRVQGFNDNVASFNSLQTLLYSTGASKNSKVSFEGLTSLKELELTSFSNSNPPRGDMRGSQIIRSTFLENGLRLPKSLKKITLGGFELNQDVIDELATLKNLKEIKFKKCLLNNLNFEPLYKLKKISTVEIINENWKRDYDHNEDLDSNIINQFKNTKKLTLENVRINNEHIKEISNLANLKELILTENMYSELDFSPLMKLTGLTTFRFKKAYLQSFDENVLTYFKNLKKLTIGTDMTSSNLINNINGLTKLEELIIIPDEDDRYDITTLNKLKKLKTLELHRPLTTSSNVDYDLRLFKNLKKLVLDDVSFSRDTIKQISKLTKLEELQLISIDFSLNFDSLKNLKKNLIILEISSTSTLEPNTEIPEFVYELSNLKKFVYYQILEDPVEIPAKLANLKNLEYLSFGGSTFSSIPVELATLPNLKYINLYWAGRYGLEIPEELEGIIYYDYVNAEYPFTN